MSDIKNRILLLSEYFYPSQNSTAYYITEIAKEIAKNSNNRVDIYCATPTNGSEFLFRENLTIHRIDNGKGNKDNPISRILKNIRMSLKFFFVIIARARSNDIIFSEANPVFIVPLCAILKVFFHYKYILLSYDLFPENLVVANLIQEDRFIYNLTKRIFDWGYAKADVVISIGRDMSEVLKKKGILEDRIVLIQNWADTESIKYFPKNQNPIIKKYHLAEKRVFLFAGNFGRVQGIPELLDVIDHVASDNAAFLFVGDGAMRGAIEEYQKTHPQKAIYCHPYLPMDQQNIFLNACDIAIVTLNDNMIGLGVPSKTYFSLASGHPILFIGDEKSEVSLIIKEGHCGWQTTFKKINECAKLIDHICTIGQEDLEHMGKLANEFISFNYSHSIILKKYANLFESISSNGGIGTHI